MDGLGREGVRSSRRGSVGGMGRVLRQVWDRESEEKIDTEEMGVKERKLKGREI